MFVIPEKVMRFGYGFLAYKVITITRGLVVNPLIYLISDKKMTSFILMVSVTFFSSLIIVLVYDHLKRDFILIESLKKSREEKSEQIPYNSVTKKIVKWGKYGDWALIIFLIVWDPALALVYCRPGSYQWNKIPNITMLALFFFSSLSCNIVGLTILEPLKILLF